MVESKVSVVERSMWIVNTLFHQTYAVVTVFIIWTLCYNLDTSSKFFWHTILSTIAYVPLMGEAIILFAGDNVWSRKIDRTTKYWIHGFLLLVSGILVTAGISIIVDGKGSSAKHFKSIHGWTGLVSWIFVLLSQFIGLAAAKTQIFNSFLRPVYIKCCHNFLGLLGYVFGIISLCYGLETRSFSGHTSKDSRTATYCLLAFATTWSILAALKSLYNQLKTILFK